MRNLLLAVLLISYAASGQLIVQNTQTPANLVQNVLLGTGVTATNITFNGAPANVVTDQVGYFDGAMSNIGLSDGLIMATGDVSLAVGPNNQASMSGGGTGNVPGFCDPDLQTLVFSPNLTALMDCAVLEFDFVPTSDTLRFDFVFASEEYPQFAPPVNTSGINDVFGFFLSGPGIAGPFTNGAQNIALIPGTPTPIYIANVNPSLNSIYYVSNGDGFTAPFNVDPFYVQYNGFTTPITAEALVTCGQTYHIKLAIADMNDNIFDSAVFLEGGSFASFGQTVANLGSGAGIVNDSTIIESCANVELNFFRDGDLTVTEVVDLTVGGTATAGVDYSPAIPPQITFMPGDSIVTLVLTVPVDADGQETIDISVEQNFTCSGQPGQLDYTFYIENSPPLLVTGNDVAITCNQSVDIGAVASGGIGSVYSYAWNTGPTTDSINVAPAVTTDYIVTATDSCGTTASDTITVTLPVYLPIDLTVTPDTAVQCLTNVDLVVLNATGGDGNYSYQWTDSLGNALVANDTLTVPSSDPTMYFVTATDGCGATATDSVQVSTAVLPPIDITTVDSLVPLCIGDMVDLDVISVTGGNGVYTYQWSLAGNSVGAGTPVSVPVNNNSIYVVTVEDQCGNESTAQIATVIPQNPPLELEVLESMVICLGESVDLFANISGGSGVYSIEWPTVTDLNGNVLTDPQFTDAPTDELNYYPVIVTDACGQVIADSTLIIVEDVQTDIVVTQPGQDDVTLFAASDPPGETFFWDMGDGTTYRGQDVSHSYLTIDYDFFVTLVVTTPNGCRDTSVVEINPPAHVYFPNSFTPDGDGLNDVWGPVGHDLELLELVIFDRWGQEVFSSFSTGQYIWDGRVNGNGNAIPGVYVYKYRAAGHLLPNFEGMGHVTLVR